MKKNKNKKKMKKVVLSIDNGINWEKSLYPNNFKSLQELIKNKFKFDDIENYKFIEKSISREIIDQSDFELMTKHFNEQDEISIFVVKKDKEQKDIIKNSNNKAENKLLNKIEKDKVNNGSNINTINIQIEEKDENNNLIKEVIDKLKEIDYKSLEILSDAIQNEIFQRKMKKMEKKQLIKFKIHL